MGKEKIPFVNRMERFHEELTRQFEEVLKAEGAIGDSVYIVSHFCTSEKKAFAYKFTIRRNSLENYSEEEELVLVDDGMNRTVVCDGQDQIIDRMLYGSLYRQARWIAYKVADQLCKQLNLSETEAETAIDKLMQVELNNFVLNEEVIDELHLVNIRELSMQEAVNFASLLIRIVRDVQMYSENIPTVGGVIKLAVIKQKGGFEALHGDKLSIPNIIQ